MLYLAASSRESSHGQTDASLATFDDDDDALSRLPSGKRTRFVGARNITAINTTIKNASLSPITFQQSTQGKHIVHSANASATSEYKHARWKTAVVSVLIGPMTTHDTYWLQVQTFETSLRNTGYSGKILVLHTGDVSIDKSLTKSVSFQAVDKITRGGRCIKDA